MKQEDEPLNIYTTQNLPSPEKKEEIRDFLYQNLDEYGDPAYQIEAAMNYALGYNSSPGGAIISYGQDPILGAVVLNRTGMSGYIPENILVYIATAAEVRGRGIGKLLMQTAIENTTGDIALHVEADNPARFLYEKLGFTNPYLEMRLKK